MADLIKILYVDDDKATVESFRRLFGDSESYEILTAFSEAEALQILDEQKTVGLVVADYRLPGMTGVEFLTRVGEQCPDTSRVVLANYVDVEPVIKAIEEGRIYKFVAKPWNPEDLKCTLLTVLQHQQLRQQNALLQKDLQKKTRQLERCNESRDREIARQTEVLQIRNRVLQIAQEVLDVLPVAVFGIDAERVIVQCNDLARDLFPSGVMGPIGCSCQEVFPPELNALLDSALSGQVSNQLISIRDRNHRAEVRRLEGRLAKGVVLALIPE